MIDQAPTMLYFGPWDMAGHFLFWEDGRSEGPERAGMRERPRNFAWHEMGYYQKPTIDGELQPRSPSSHPDRPGNPMPEGVAALHHLNGWTALCFWDYSVDTRPGSNSNYFAEGIFTFEEMVEMAKSRFPYRWNKMKFKVTPVP